MLTIADQVSPITDAQFQNEKVDDERDLFIFRHCLFSFFRERERDRVLVEQFVFTVNMVIQCGAFQQKSFYP